MDRRAFLAGSVAFLTAPRSARGQPATKRPRIGWLTVVRHDTPLFKAFAEGLREAGYVVERNVAMDFREPAHPDRFEEFAGLAGQLVTVGADVIYAGGPFAVEALARATKTIPIVAIDLESDPVLKGWVSSLARPRGNITGFFLDIPEMSGKQLQLLRETKPNLARIAVLGHPRINELQFRVTATAAQREGLALQQLPVASLDEIPGMIAEAARQHAGALLALSNPLVLRSIQRIADAALKHQLPAICPFTPAFAQAGGLMAYGPDLPDLFRRAGGYVARTLKGAKPGDLPVQRPETFDFVINLKTAKALGLTIPPSLLARADHVIE